MNKIYKVVWSKVKNCYVVVSEIAKNVLSGGVKSAKVGAAPVIKGVALGTLMAVVITGNAWAAGNYQYADYQGQTVSLNGNLNVVGTGNNAYGIDAENSTITLGSNGAVVKFDLTATANGGEAVAVWGNNSTIDIVADKFEIKTSGSETGSLQANGGTQITVVSNEADISGVIWAAGEGSIVNLMQAGNLS
ncbi:MAG: ESPR domain-containing protein, partial [Phascolarctobacterium sp.]|nr:ESPR domain-containing protein [Phascolarctobacterium sp.]